WLNLSKVGLPGDARPDLGAALAQGSNYHVPEFNLAEGNFLAIAEMQTESWQAKQQARANKLKAKIKKLKRKVAKQKRKLAAAKKKSNRAKAKKAKKKIKSLKKKIKKLKKEL